jgi:DNA-binding response OmpR family regulator
LFSTACHSPLIVKNSPSINKTRGINPHTIALIMDQLSVEQKRAGIVVVGGDSSLHYLLERYAGRIGYPVSVEKSPSSAETIRKSEPVAVIFPSVEILEGAQSLAVELTNYDIPIIVCSSVFDQAKTRELGADYCLLHPLVFDSFSSTLKAAVTSQRGNGPVDNEVWDSLPINPV